MDLYRYLRNYFIANYKYNVPILIHSAHDHILQKYTCNYTNDETGEVVSDDPQCYQTDAGNYLKYMIHMTYTFEAEEVAYEEEEEIKKFTGSKLVNRTNYVDYYDKNQLVNIIDDVDYGFAARFNKTPETFDTEHGKQLRAQIQQWSEELNLTFPQGYSKFTYKKNDNYEHDAENSLFRFWTDAVYPNIVFKDETKDSCQQIAITSSGSLRADLTEGVLVLDDIVAVQPFENFILGIFNISSDVAECVREYFISHNYDANDHTPGRCVDFVTNNYDAEKI